MEVGDLPGTWTATTVVVPLVKRPSEVGLEKVGRSL